MSERPPARPAPPPAGPDARPSAPPRTCPVCGRPALAVARPFCSRRCADLDLARWLGGVYRIASDEAATEPDEGA